MAQEQTVTLIPGDGIGSEIVGSVKEIFKAADIPIKWEEIPAGQSALDSEGELIPKRLIDSIEKNQVALKGPVTTPVGKGFKSINVQLRQLFDLYSNVRPCLSTPGISSKFDNVDLVIFRENTEGLYSGLEFYDERLQVADSIARVSYQGSYRLIKDAFEFARKQGRKKVTIAHKANILKQSSGLFLNTGWEVAKEYPDIEVEDKIIDNLCMQLVMHPEEYDVIATTNLFGDIVSDLCAGLVGGLGVVSGMNKGDDVTIFEAVHGSAPDIAGQGKANPTAILRSAILMLRQLDYHDQAKEIENALQEVFANREHCTADLGGKASTSEFTQHIIDRLAYVRKT